MKAYLATVLIAAACASPARAAVTVINADAHYPEGPVWYHGKLFYVEYNRNTVMTWDGKHNTVFASQKGCGQSAVIPTSNGEFLTTCGDNNTIGRMSAAGKQLEPYTHDRDGNTFVTPNDFAPDARGGIYFTTSGNNNAFAIAAAEAAAASNPATPRAPLVDGKVFYIAPDRTITQKATDLHGANGLAVSRDGAILYVVESDEHRLVKFDIAPDGSLVNQRLFIDLDDLTHHVVHILPDGVKIDSQGSLYIGQSAQQLNAPLAGVIFVVDADARLLRTLQLPSLQVPNLAFSPDEKTLYVTAVDQIDKPPYRGKVYSVPNR